MTATDTIDRRDAPASMSAGAGRRSGPRTVPPDDGRSTPPGAPLSVLLVGNYERGYYGSMHAYLRMLNEELTRLGHRVTVEIPPRRLGPAEDAMTGLGKWLAYLDRYLLFAPRLWRLARRHDIVHVVDHGNAMHGFVVPRRRLVVTCHDVIVMQAARGMVDGWHVRPTGRLYQRLILRGLERARAVICVSALTRRDLQRLTPGAQHLVVTIENGLNAPFAPASATEQQATRQRLGLPERPYFLHVGTDHPRKHRVMAARLWAGAARARGDRDSLLVLVGPPPAGEMLAFLDGAGLLDRVVAFPDGLPHADLTALYSGAQALLFPSLLEGFGWPIIEAQACGCPVVTSDREPMNTLGGDAARCFDPLDAKAGVAALLGALRDAPALRRAGLANAARFSAAAMTARCVEVYRQVLAAPAGPTPMPADPSP